MTDYESMHKLTYFLEATQHIEKHRSDSCGWEVAKAIDAVMIEQLFSAMEKSPFCFFSVDETASIDTVEYLSVCVKHSYS